MKLLPDCRLYTFVDTAYLRGREPQVVAQQLCDGGSDIIQLRAKTSTPDEIRRMATAIRLITSRADVLFVVNDHLDIAAETGAEICHLGQGDFFNAGHRHVAEIRNPKSKIRIGLSSHSPEQAGRALAAGADYIAIGPVYATGTKPTAKPVTLEYVRWAASPQSGVNVPWFAIGGINLNTIGDVLAAGARRVCVVSAILNADDIAGACREFKRRLM
jgi:thiamine-phosphate pyrophosphorylase